MSRERSESGFRQPTVMVIPRRMPAAALAYEHMGGSGEERRPPRHLGDLYHTLPQEPDVCPSIALALEQLQAVDMALDGPISPGQGEPRFDRREVFV